MEEIVAGDLNSILGPFASVTGGVGNQATGISSSISGGLTNTASGNYSSISGGYINTASTTYATVSGALPQYDSGYVSIGQAQTITLTHNLGGDPNDYIVDVHFYDNDGNGRNHNRYGVDITSTGLWAGAYWSRLTSTSIDLFRGGDDITADSIRVRIWVNKTP